MNEMSASAVTEWVIIGVVAVFQVSLLSWCWYRFASDAASRRRRIDGWSQTVADLRSDRALRIEQIRHRGLSMGELHSVFLLEGTHGVVAKRPGALVASVTPVELEEAVSGLDAKEYLALLPALGLLGTFVGIAFALQKAQFASGMAVDVMTDRVASVVHAAGIVFWCSVIGLILLLIGQVIHRFYVFTFNQARIDALAKFDQGVEFQSPVATLARLNFDAFEASATQLGTAGGQIAQIVGTLSSSARALAASASAMEAAAQSMKTTMEEHIAPFGARIEEFTETSSTFTGSVEGLKASNALLSRTSQELATSVRGLTDAMHEGLDASVARMQETMKRMTEETSEASRAFVKQWNDSLGTTLGRMERVAGSFGEQTKELGDTTKTAMETFRSSWEETVGRTIGELDGLSGQLGTLAERMGQTNGQMQASASSLETGMTQVRTGFEQSMKTLGSQLEEELGKAGRAFATGTDVIQSRLESLDAATASSLGVLEQTKQVALSIDGAASNLRIAIVALEAASKKQTELQHGLVGEFFEQAGSAVAELTVQLQDTVVAMRQAAQAAPRA